MAGIDGISTDGPALAMAMARRGWPLVGLVAAGTLLVGLQLLVGYHEAVRRSGDGRSWAWLVALVGLPVIAYLGARRWPGSPWATAGAVLAAHLALVITMKARTLGHLGWIGARLLAWQVALVAVTSLAARAGDRRTVTHRDD